MINSATDERAILAVIDGYTDALNHRAWDRVEPLFMLDAVWGTVNFRDYGFKGARAIAEGLRSILDPAPLFVQMRTATVITVAGDTADARSTVHERGDIGAGNYICYGSYADRLQRQDGIWRFARRDFRYLYWQEGLAAGQSFRPHQ